jgi:Co/Zn/Cd efflux system component
MALAAIVAGDRAPTGNGRTYGLYRLEILAALANAVLLFAVAGYVILEAVRRLQEPSEVLVIPMLVVAVAGLAINLIGWRLLRPGAIESLTMSPETLGRRAARGVCHRRPGRPVPILRPGFEDGVSQWESACCMGAAGLPVDFSDGNQTWKAISSEERVPTDAEIGIDLVYATASDLDGPGCEALTGKAFSASPGRDLAAGPHWAGSRLSRRSDRIRNHIPR